MTTKKEMLECLREWHDLYFHEVNCSEKYNQETLEHHNKSYDAILALIESKRKMTRANLTFMALKLYGAARVNTLEKELSEILAELGIEVKEK